MQIYGLVENHTFLEQFVSRGVPGHFSNMIEQFVSMGGTRTIFSTLHGSLWLGKDKGSIMESAEICGTITFVKRHGTDNLANIMDHIGETYHL